MHSKISRRDFLKVAGTALGGLAFTPYLPPVSSFDDRTLIRVASNGLESKGIPVRSKPTDKSSITRSVFMNDLLPVYEEIVSDTPGYNPVWYRVWGGFVHRARMQKVQFIYNDPAKAIRETGQIAEVTVPYTQTLRRVGKEWRPAYTLYYETVHWVVGIDEGPDGQPWYRLLDELDEAQYHVPATHLRLIPDEELVPISPEVPFEKKRIEVSLGNQTVTCYENDQVAFQTIISSGRLSSKPGPNGIPTRTPAGNFRVQDKMPSKHMGDGNFNLAADLEAYELPGVPWVTFFTPQGHAFHGTYWHDNFGVPMSSGCINMRTAEAKWLFRWCLPAALSSDMSVKTPYGKRGYGTPVKIVP